MFIILSDHYHLSLPTDIPACVWAGVAWTMFCSVPTVIETPGVTKRWSSYDIISANTHHVGYVNTKSSAGPRVVLRIMYCWCFLHTTSNISLHSIKWTELTDVCVCVCCLVWNEFLNVLQTNFMLRITLHCFASAWRNQQDDRTLPGTYRAIVFSSSCDTLTSTSSACLICFSSYSFFSVGYNVILNRFFMA
jgi:hypothetical protein